MCFPHYKVVQRATAVFVTKAREASYQPEKLLSFSSASKASQRATDPALAHGALVAAFGSRTTKMKLSFPSPASCAATYRYRPSNRQHPGPEVEQAVHLVTPHVEQAAGV